MAPEDIVLIAACGIFGFGIIWTMVPKPKTTEDQKPPPDAP